MLPGSYQKPLRWIESQLAAMTTQLTGWCAINSGTFNPAGLATLAEQIAAEFNQFAEVVSLRDAGMFEVIDNNGHSVSCPLGKNLHVVQRPKAPKRVLLAIHMDTVYGIESPFQHVKQDDANTLCGPGVADAKGGIVILLTALKAFEQFVAATGQSQLGWDAIINSDEEIGSPGSRGLFEEAAANVQLGLLFEPSLPDGKLVSARKGSGNFSIVARGRAAHSGRDFQNGINAVIAAAEASTQLHKLTGQWDEMTLNVARIDGGGPSNMVPPVAIIRLNIRYRHSQHSDEILRTIQQILDDVSIRSGVRFELCGQFAAPPKLLDESTEQLLNSMQSCGKKIGIPLSWAPSGGACDGNRLAALGIPNIDTLGVRGGKIHSQEEFVLIDSLIERAQLTALFLMQLADGNLDAPLPTWQAAVQ